MGLNFTLNFNTLRNLKPAGFVDNAAFLSIASGMLVTNPYVRSLLGGIDLSMLGASIAGAGAGWITERAIRAAGMRVFDSELNINSDKVPPVRIGEGMTLGYCVDNGRPLVIPWEDWMRHAFILGMTGVGKTVIGAWLLFQQIIKGGGIIQVDGKLDPDNLDMLRMMCAWAGREDDLLVINPGKPAMSNSYNPILYGDADEVASRVLSLMPSAESNPGADYYRQAALQGITTLVKAVQRSGRAYNFMDINILLQNQRALAWLESIVPAASSERKELSIFLEMFKTVTKDGAVSIDLKKVRDTFGGIGGRMHQFGSGNFGMITNSYSPDVNLFEAIRSNKIVYVALPTMGKKEAASNFGKMFIGDVRSATAMIQDLPKEERPWPPCLCFFDEAGSYSTPTFTTMFEQARSAHMVMMPAVQTMANLDTVSDEFREQVIGNTWTKMFFKIGTDDTGEKSAELIGKETHVAYSLNVSDGSGISKSANPGGGAKGKSQSDSIGYTEREDEGYKVSPDNLKSLNKGECIVTYGGSRVYHIKVPQVKFSDEFKSSLGPVQINRLRPRFVRGLDLFRDADRWLSGGDGDD